jgi:acyl-CoA reductase-like NAD-dependent aldehyde dehydrogenase
MLDSFVEDYLSPNWYAGCVGKDTSRAWQVAGRIESGICHINGPTVHDEAQMPFGGVKSSGYGRFGGQAGPRNNKALFSYFGKFHLVTCLSV